VLLVLLLILGAIAAATLGRSSLAHQARSKVAVTAADGALTCAPSASGDPGITTAGAAIVRADMRCEYAFTVSNSGSTTVRIDAINLPLLGPNAGGAVKAEELLAGEAKPLETGTHDEGAVRPSVATTSDALFPLSHDLRGRESKDFRIVIVHRPDGCAPKGWTLTPSAEVIVTVTSLGLTGERRGSTPGLRFRSTTDLNECD
jgi:hypothetical protein